MTRPTFGKIKFLPMYFSAQSSSFSDLDPNTFEPILDVTASSHVQSGLSLRAGAIYITRIKARNQAKLITSHETSGIRVDPTPPVVSADC